MALARVWSSTWGVRPLVSWLRCHPAETLMLSRLALYWGVSLTSKLNLGVRHLLPVFPFTILLVSREVIRWLGTVQNAGRHARLLRVGTRGAVAVLLLWQCGSVLHVYPAFLAYFNEAVGRPAGGVHYVGDSNLDWGQDLRRLRAFVDAQQIDRIAVAYFRRQLSPLRAGPTIHLLAFGLGAVQRVDGNLRHQLANCPSHTGVPTRQRL